jgi:hypothetical protein
MVNKAIDSCKVHRDYYLSQEAVDCWTWPDLSGDHDEDLCLAVSDATDDSDNPCASCWKNMMTDKTSCMWSVFDETGIFLSLCHHGYSLLVADMVQSSEQ